MSEAGIASVTHEMAANDAIWWILQHQCRKIHTKNTFFFAIFYFWPGIASKGIDGINCAETQTVKHFKCDILLASCLRARRFTEFSYFDYPPLIHSGCHVRTLTQNTIESNWERVMNTVYVRAWMIFILELERWAQAFSAPPPAGCTRSKPKWKKIRSEKSIQKFEWTNPNCSRDSVCCDRFFSWSILWFFFSFGCKIYLYDSEAWALLQSRIGMAKTGIECQWRPRILFRPK